MHRIIDLPRRRRLNGVRRHVPRAQEISRVTQGRSFIYWFSDHLGNRGQTQYEGHYRHDFQRHTFEGKHHSLLVIQKNWIKAWSATEEGRDCQTNSLFQHLRKCLEKRHKNMVGCQRWNRLKQTNYHGNSWRPLNLSLFHTVTHLLICCNFRRSVSLDLSDLREIFYN